MKYNDILEKYYAEQITERLFADSLFADNLYRVKDNKVTKWDMFKNRLNYKILNLRLKVAEFIAGRSITDDW